MLRVLTLLLLLQTLSGPALAASRPCTWWMRELGVWGVLPDDLMELRGHKLVPNQINPLGQTYEELYFRITEKNIPQLAQRLALQYPAKDLENGLRQNLSNGYIDIPLTPFLPQRVQCKLGTADTDPCYSAALDFHSPYQWNGSADDAIAFVRENYSTIGYGDRQRFGDLLLFWSQASERPFTFHIAIYLGGDFVYHKYGPTEQANYEYHTLDSLGFYYSQSGLRTPQMRFFGQPFLVEMLRYDPLKQMPPAKSVPR